MKLTLPVRISLFLTLIILVISGVSTYLFTSAHRNSKEQGRVVRGGALVFALAKAAEDGLLNENLDLIKKSSSVIQSPDVELAQVFSDFWDAVDAYPMESLHEPPDPGAIEHFRSSAAWWHRDIGGAYDFYAPIQFRMTEISPPTTIGYARIILSSAGIAQELRGIVVLNVTVSAVITLVAVVLVNVLVQRLVLKPVLALHRAVSVFHDGGQPDLAAASVAPDGELRELSDEFFRLFRAVRDKERKLVESEAKIRDLFDRVEHGLFRTDAQGTIIETNRRFRELFGGVTGLCDILIGERSAGECLRSASMRPLFLEDRALGRSGDQLSIALSLYPDREPEGALRGFDGYIMDLTERKRFEERLIRSQKMEAIGTLASGMAHEFNNLLTAILGYSGILVSKIPDDDPLHRPAEIIHGAAKRGAQFGKRILSVTRKERMDARLLRINDVVKSSVELLHKSVPRNVEIVMNLADGLSATRGDMGQVQQVIINMVVNACDAMPEGGRIVIETSAEGGGSEAAGGVIKLSVSDTGCGIDTAAQNKIFDPFFTTKETGKGTGLGLYIAHAIVTNHGGYINVYSEQGKGTRFNIYLPVVRTEGAEESGDPMELMGSGVVLVIDDEGDVRELCRDMLEPLGYTVLLAENGMSGVNLFRERKDEIGMVILDVIMPKMSGREVFQALKTIRPEVKVLICSGYSKEGYGGINQLLSQGAVGFVQKPFSRSAIAAAVKAAMTD